LSKIRFVMIGGFLGAGKTTTIAKVAKSLIAEGNRVALVTNDQAYNLVDTQTLRSQGFDVGEVPGACFCCKFDDLVQTAERLAEHELPDWIIAEPVGSCTDLAATVVEPMRQLYGDRFELGPLAVLLKPEHGLKILRNEQKAGFSTKAAYIFRKQLEEADVIVVNKIDKLDDAAQQELFELIKQQFNGAPVFGMSARNGTGIDTLVSTLKNLDVGPRKFMDVDYDVYAEGEAELGWLNCQVDVSTGSEEKFALDSLVLMLVKKISEQFADADIETAHLKVMGQTISETAVANHVARGCEAELSLASEIMTSHAELWINARVATDPDRLRTITESAVTAIAGEENLLMRVSGMQNFKPGRPVPVHRMTG
jgi:Ni2+-binding GTPase involved in maturation of urease and hydrogenase